MRTGLQTHLSDLKLEDFARSLYWNLRLLPRALTSADRRLVRAYFRSHTKRKLHVGCGDHPLDGWLDADLYPTSTRILRLDANQTYPLGSNLFDYAFSEHLIEHLEFAGARNMLAECFRVLKPGGRLRIVTPDLEALLKLYGEKSALQERYIQWSTRQYASKVFGYEDTFYINNFVRDWGHLFIYDEKVLRSSFGEAGFVNIARHRINASEDPNLRGLENEERMPAGFLDMESIVIEGAKP